MVRLAVVAVGMVFLELEDCAALATVNRGDAADDCDSKLQQMQVSESCLHICTADLQYRVPGCDSGML